MHQDFIVMIHCLTYLAVHKGQRFSSQELAENACSNPVIVRRLMKLAANEGFISIKNGKSGGYVIEADPDSISLSQLFMLVGEDEKARKEFKEAVDETCMVASNIGAVLGQVQEDAIRSQIEYYSQRNIQHVMDELKLRHRLVQA